jgi:FAD/FMN-containing dehydrogenase
VCQITPDGLFVMLASATSKNLVAFSLFDGSSFNVLGGTITGEHGVGLAKKAEMTLQFSDSSIALHHTLKKAMDPLGIFNPGKIFSPAK